VFIEGQDAPDAITSLAMDGNAVWASAGPHAIKYMRGKEVRFVCMLVYAIYDYACLRSRD
jgi:hypothetical protein